MKYLMIKFQDNYADEFDIHGVWFSTEEDYEEFVTAIRKYFEKHTYREVYFGTNESVKYDCADSLLDCMTEVEISKCTYEEMSEKLGDYGGINLDWIYEDEEE